jgi:AcrR family transcriptional regulator
MRSENVTKDKILITAARIFAEKGFEATSMREIAEACSVTKPALYYYFPIRTTYLSK